MAIQSIGIRAYTQALSNFQKAEQSAMGGAFKAKEPQQTESTFSSTLQDSLNKVNELRLLVLLARANPPCSIFWAVWIWQMRGRLLLPEKIWPN